MQMSKSFLIDIVDTQNHTWQGKIRWVQEQKEVPFRSALEMMELIQSAVGDETDEENESSLRRSFDEA